MGVCVYVCLFTLSSTGRLHRESLNKLTFISELYVQAFRAQGLELVASMLSFGQGSNLSHFHQVICSFSLTTTVGPTPNIRGSNVQEPTACLVLTVRTVDMHAVNTIFHYMHICIN